MHRLPRVYDIGSNGRHGMEWGEGGIKGCGEREGVGEGDE